MGSEERPTELISVDDASSLAHKLLKNDYTVNEQQRKILHLQLQYRILVSFFQFLGNLVSSFLIPLDDNSFGYSFWS